MYTNESTCFN